MNRLTATILAEASGGQWLAAPPASIDGVGIDSRDALAGRIFAAIAGPTHDGHDHLQEAVANGAVGAIVQREVPGAGCPCLLVENVRSTLARASAAYRRTLGETVVVAITGSAGKTTTRRMLETVLAAKGPGSASPKSFNNDLGVPLTLLNARGDDRWLLVEVGTNAPGEIRQLGALVEPDMVLITGIGQAHLEGLGNLQAVAKEKASLLSTLRPGGMALVNTDQEGILPELTVYDCAIETFGHTKDADIRLLARRQVPGGQEIEVGDGFAAMLPLPGEHNAINALGVYGIAKMMGMDNAAIQDGLARVTPAPMRMERVDLGDRVVWNDAYNANPESMAAALATFVEEEEGTGRLVAVLGAMLELGAESEELHRKLGRMAARAGLDVLIGVGSQGETVVNAARDAGFTGVTRIVALEQDPNVIAEWFFPGDRVLLKASRGVGLERVLAVLKSSGEVAR